MKLYLMRHGHSPTAHEAGVHSDVERPLSERGRVEAQKAAEQLKARAAKPGLALCSPLVRAKQTAEQVAAAFGAPVRVYKPLDNLLSGAELLELVLAEHWPAHELLLVGHMPQIGEAAARLAGEPMAYPTAGLAAFERGADSEWRLLWRAGPDGRF